MRRRRRRVERARAPVDARQHVLRSDRGEALPGADAQNASRQRKDWDDHADWHLGLTQGAGDHAGARYTFVLGDFRRVHRSPLITCVHRASQWRHEAVGLAARDLLRHLDDAGG